MSPPRAGRLASALMATLAAAGLAGGALAGCERPPPPRSAAAQGEAIPSVDAGAFTTGFSMMRRLRAVTRLGTGKIGVLLPDTTTSPRYAEFDAPYLARALQEAGLGRSQFIITNAQGSDATEQAQAESDMTQGATVLLLDPIDSGVGASIESAAASMGVKVIDYDRMTLGGTRAYYVSFDNVAVGALMARGLVNCIRAWHVRRPDVLVMRGAPTDNNATLFARGYDQVLRPYFASGRYAAAGQPPGSWNPTTAQTTFEEQYTANNKITAVLTPNDDTASAVISYLKTLNTPPRSLPHHRPGRDPRRAGQHPVRLPVRHRLQADLPGGAGGRGAHPVPEGRAGPAAQPGQRHHLRSHQPGPGAVRAAAAGVGHRGQHGGHGDQGPVRDGRPAVRRPAADRLPPGQDRELTADGPGEHHDPAPRGSGLAGAGRERRHLRDHRPAS